MSAAQLGALARWIAIALFTVTSLAVDAADIVVNDAGTAIQAFDGRCTLREAMRAANSDMASGAAAGECAAGSGADVITLASTTQLYTLTTIDNSGTNGLPLVVSEITIEGNGATIQRSGAAGTPNFRLFQVGPTSRLTLRNLELRNGRAETGGALVNGSGTVVLQGVEVSASVATCDGGGIASYGGSVFLDASAVHDNTAGCSGGAIFARDAGVRLQYSEIVSNVASTGGGGGIMLFGAAEGIIQRSTIAGNTAVLDGGGLLAHGAATFTVLVETFVTNNRCEPLPGTAVGGNGGGIANGRTNNEGGVSPLVAGGDMYIIGSTISHNVGARNEALTSRAFGGGVSNVGQLTIEGSQILENNAVDGRGGGISTLDVDGLPSGVVVRDSRIEGNTAGEGQGGGIVSIGTAMIERTLLRGNSASNGGAIQVRGQSGPGIGAGTQVIASAITGNTAAFGSAIAVSSEVPIGTYVTSTTISGNTVTAGEFGGGAVHASRTIVLNGVTLVDNRGGRGGIFNSSTDVFLYNTIVVANRDYADAFVDCVAVGAMPTWQGSYNMTGEGTGCAVAGPGMRTVAPEQLFSEVVGPLSDATTLPAHIPLPQSAALDNGDSVPETAGVPGGCPSSDQQGRDRPQDDNGDGDIACDIGALEGASDIFRDDFEDPA